MDKLETLQDILSKMNKLCVCYSGGVDSVFLLKAAKDALGDSVFAVIADGPMLPRRELAEAVSLAEEIGVPCRVITVNPFAVPEFQRNERTRCYHCKKHIFGTIKAEAEKLGASFIADGKNADDEKAQRPGAKAAEELCVVSPLCQAGLTKDDIRELSREAGLPTWQKPAAACLATRFPNNTLLTPELLFKAEATENVLFDGGVPGARARIHGNILRIEAPKSYFSDIVNRVGLTAELKELRFDYITLDLEGYRSGSMDI